MRFNSCYRAPTKVILFGEHFVVRGTPAIAAATSLYTYACWRQRSDNYIIIYSVNLGLKCRIYPRNECGSAMEGFARIAREAETKGLDIVVYTEAPIGAGLGSSASASTTIAAALLDAAGRLEENRVWELAFEAEKVYHGRPSGIDNMVALKGGFIFYHARMLYERLEARHRISAIIADTGIPRSTRDAVLRVLERYERMRDALQHVYIAASRLVWSARRALERGDIRALGELMDVNHGLLYALGVSIPEIERLVWSARRAGALGAKLTGAGLGGTILALVEPSSAPLVAKALRDAGARGVYSVELGVPGLERIPPDIVFKLVREADPEGAASD